MIEQVIKDPERAKAENRPAWLAQKVYEKTKEKLASEPIEDLRIDFEDGYGFRANDEEDKDAQKAAEAMAHSFLEGSLTPFSGIRIKPLSGKTRDRAIKTYRLFTVSLLERTNGRLPDNFVVTLPRSRLRKKQNGFFL